MSSGVRRVFLQLICGTLLFLAIDAALFRTGAWLRWVAPTSGLGNVKQALANVAHLPPRKGGVVVMGDSRMGEGFSAPVATDAATRAGAALTFANGAVAGSLPRGWFYMLRQAGGAEDRVAAVVIAVESFHDDDRGIQAERREDLLFVHPFLRLADLFDYPFTYLDPASRMQAAEAILFKGLFFKSDLQDFLTHPLARIREADAWRKHGLEWMAAYPGQKADVTGMTIDAVSGAVAFSSPRPVDPTLQTYVDLLRRYRGRPPENTGATEYRRLWLGRLADWCRDHGSVLYVLRLPRGPLHHTLAPDDAATGVVAQMEAAGRLRTLPAATFAALERPEYFFDGLHMNGAGRVLFSGTLGRAMAQLLPAR